jgi:hypothetical protein
LFGMGGGGGEEGGDTAICICWMATHGAFYRDNVQTRDTRRHLKMQLMGVFVFCNQLLFHVTRAQVSTNSMNSSSDKVEYRMMYHLKRNSTTIITYDGIKIKPDADKHPCKSLATSPVTPESRPHLLLGRCSRQLRKSCARVHMVYS